MTAIIFIAVLLIAACQKELGNLLIDEPKEPPVYRQLAVRTNFTDGADPANYSISLRGPINLDTVVTGSVAFIDHMVKGEYVISVGKEGYIPSVKRHLYREPADASISFKDGINFQLNKRLSPVSIDHEEGGKITIPADGNLLTEEMEIIVPAGALEGTGVTEITISPAKVDVSLQNGEWTELLNPITLVCEPSGLVFKKPLQVKIPLDPNISADVQQVELVLYTEDPVTGEVKPSKDPKDRVVAQVFANEGYAIAEIPHFSLWGWTNYGPGNGNSGKYSWRWRDTEGNQNGPLLYTAWSCIDQSANPGEAVSGPFLATPTTITPPANENASGPVTSYCNENIPGQGCTVNISQTYNYTPMSGNYAYVEARNRFIYVDIADQPNGGGNILTYQQAYNISGAIEFRFNEGPSPSAECP